MVDCGRDVSTHPAPAAEERPTGRELLFAGGAGCVNLPGLSARLRERSTGQVARTKPRVPLGRTGRIGPVIAARPSPDPIDVLDPRSPIYRSALPGVRACPRRRDRGVADPAVGVQPVPPSPIGIERGRRLDRAAPGTTFLGRGRNGVALREPRVTGPRDSGRARLAVSLQPVQPTPMPGERVDRQFPAASKAALHGGAAYRGGVTWPDRLSCGFTGPARWAGP